MQRREFLAFSGLGLAGLLLPHSRAIAAEQLLAPVDTLQRRRLADVALATARTAKASYCDVRIGRYLNQSVITREHQVGNVTNRESSGVGVRVIVNGAWGFAATHQQTEAAVRAAVEQAAAIARANASIQTRPVQLAPTPPVGEVRWQTPVRRNAMAVPIQDKVELLLALNAAALDAGADYINSTLFLVNEQKYFASSDGSFIDQDIHRIWLPFTATAIDKASDVLERQLRKFKTRYMKARHEAVPMPEPGPAEAAVDAGLDDVSEFEPEIVRQKRFDLRPMSAEDAVVQMEALGHDFYVFANMASGQTGVVYRRKDGHYGLIEPSV